MAKEQGQGGFPVKIVVIAIIVVLLIAGVVIWMMTGKGTTGGTETGEVNKYAQHARTAEDIKIKENDPQDVKVEKLQGKIEILTNQIDKKQEEITKESEAVSKLYDEYVSIMNQYQTGTTEEVVEEAPAPEGE